jgi:hypothetical protein
MSLLRDTRTAPPGDWRYVQLETGCEIGAGSLTELVEKVSFHRKYRKLEPVDKALVLLDVQRQICSGLGDRFCIAEEGETHRYVRDRSRSLTLAKIIAFTSGLIDFVKSGGELVAPAVAKRRGNICRGCRFNVHASGCACAPFYKMLETLLPKNRQQERLRICAACGCSLQVKVNLPDDVVKASNAGSDVVFPEHCWQGKL